MKNRKLSSKAVISLILSDLLFTMPAVAFSVNGNYAISAFAEETKETEESKPEESTEPVSYTHLDVYKRQAYKPVFLSHGSDSRQDN